MEVAPGRCFGTGSRRRSRIPDPPRRWRGALVATERAHATWCRSPSAVHPRGAFGDVPDPGWDGKVLSVRGEDEKGGVPVRHASIITAATVLCIGVLVAGCATTPPARSVRGGATSPSSCPASGPEPSVLKTVRPLTTVQWHQTVPALTKESPEPNGVWEDGARAYCGKWGRVFVWSGVEGGHPVIGTFVAYPSPPPYFPDVRWTDSRAIGPVTITGADGAQKGIVRFRAVAKGGITGTVDVWTGKWKTSASPVGE